MGVGFREALLNVCKLTKRPTPYFEKVFDSDQVLVEVIVSPHQPVRGHGNNVENAEDRASQVLE